MLPKSRWFNSNHRAFSQILVFLVVVRSITIDFLKYHFTVVLSGAFQAEGHGLESQCDRDFSHRRPMYEGRIACLVSDVKQPTFTLTNF